MVISTFYWSYLNESDSLWFLPAGLYTGCFEPDQSDIGVIGIQKLN